MKRLALTHKRLYQGALTIALLMSLAICPKAYAEDTEEYSIECTKATLIGNTLVVEANCTTPEEIASEYSVGMEVESGSWITRRGTGHTYADALNDSIAFKINVGTVPVDTECNYKVFMKRNEEVLCSDAGTITVRGSSDAVSGNSAVYNGTSNVWIKYQPDKAGRCTIWASGNIDCGTLYRADSRRIKNYVVDSNIETEQVIYKDHVPGNKPTFIRVSMGSDLGSYQLRFLNEPLVTKTVHLDLNGGTWEDGTSDSKVFTVEEEYDDGGYGGSGKSLNKYSNIAEKESCILVGWNTESDGSGKQFELTHSVSGGDFDNEDEMTLYAQWISKPEVSSIIFNTNKGSFSENSASNQLNEYFIKEIENINIAPVAYREGYKFIGWYKETSMPFASSAIIDGFYLPGENIDVSNEKNINLYAQWIEEDSNKRVVVLNANADGICFFGCEGNRKVEIGSCSHGTNNCDIEREGYIFTGWNTKQDGSGNHYGIFDEIDLVDEFPDTLINHLYAEWMPIELPENYVVFDGRDICFESGQHYLVLDRSSALTAPTLTKEGYTLLGWQNYPRDYDCWWAEIHLRPGDTVELIDIDNVYLYPVWAKADGGTAYHFDCNNGFFKNGFDLPRDTPLNPDVEQLLGILDIIGYSEDSERLYDTIGYSIKTDGTDTGYESLEKDEQAIADNLFRPGYILKGWNTLASGTGTHYDIGELPKDYPKTYLYAEWEPTGEKYIVFKGFGGRFDGDVESGNCTYWTLSNGKIIPPTVTNEEDCSLIGWVEKHVGGTRTHEDNVWDMHMYMPNEPIVTDSELVLYANWSNPSNEEKIVIYHANANGAAFSTGMSAAVNFTKTTSCCSQLPIRTGYDLIGWNTKADGTGTGYNVGQTIDVMSEFATDPEIVHLYAQWDAKGITVEISDAWYDEGNVYFTSTWTGPIIEEAIEIGCRVYPTSESMTSVEFGTSGSYSTPLEQETIEHEWPFGFIPGKTYRYYAHLSSPSIGWFQSEEKEFTVPGSPVELTGDQVVSLQKEDFPAKSKAKWFRYTASENGYLEIKLDGTGSYNLFSYSEDGHQLLCSDGIVSNVPKITGYMNRGDSILFCCICYDHIEAVTVETSFSSKGGDKHLISGVITEQNGESVGYWHNKYNNADAPQPFGNQIIPNGQFSLHIDVITLSSSSTDKLLIATYDSVGRMVNTYCCDFNGNRDQVFLDLNGDEFDSLKIFVLTENGMPSIEAMPFAKIV